MDNFTPVRPCQKLETCMTHISCCNLEEYISFIHQMLANLVAFEKKHPFPPFRRARTCQSQIDKQTHFDHRMCCNEDVYDNYMTVYKRILKARNLNISTHHIVQTPHSTLDNHGNH